MDRDLLYLALTFGIVLAVAGAHNVSMSAESDTVSVGYCDVDLVCDGVEAGDVCLGIEQRDVQCHAPDDIEEDYRMAEARCNVQAQNLCYEGYEGTGWAENATYEGERCSELAAEDDRFTLLSCDQMTPPVQEWTEIG